MGTHSLLMDDFYAAREAWRDEAESVDYGYATEHAEYAELHPQPTLKSFLVERRGLHAVPDWMTTYPGCEVSLPEFGGWTEDAGFCHWTADLRIPRRRATYRVVVRLGQDDRYRTEVRRVLKHGSVRLVGGEVPPTAARFAYDVTDHVRDTA